jgi:hypothetical protein
MILFSTVCLSVWSSEKTSARPLRKSVQHDIFQRPRHEALLVGDFGNVLVVRQGLSFVQLVFIFDAGPTASARQPRS